VGLNIKISTLVVSPIRLAGWHWDLVGLLLDRYWLCDHHQQCA